MTATDAVTARNDEELVSHRLHELLATFPPSTVGEREFLGAQFDAGLAFVHFPEGHGGLGLPRRLQAMVVDRLKQAGAPFGMMRNPIGYGMVAPTIVSVGSDAQRQRYLLSLIHI